MPPRKQRKMRVLVACECSGRVRNAFLAKGHDAWSCDLMSGRDPTHGRHIQGDVTPLLAERWDLVIAHPPCTFLTNAGVRWLKENPKRWRDMEAGAALFLACLNANAPKVCVENPIMHGHAMRIIGERHAQVIQPWMFGHPETKATCLWLKGLPLLKPTLVVDGRDARIHRMTPMGVKGMRGWLRSITYQGIADAMAEQWG